MYSYLGVGDLDPFFEAVHRISFPRNVSYITTHRLLLPTIKKIDWIFRILRDVFVGPRGQDISYKIRRALAGPGPEKEAEKNESRGLSLTT